MMDIDKAIEVLRDRGEGLKASTLKDLFKDEICAFDIAIEALRHERQKGHWILSQSQDKEDTDNGNYRFECSNCGHSDTHSKATEVPYCWKCGADMRGKDDE